jgi:pyruvate dehydrogenase (quinone)
VALKELAIPPAITLEQPKGLSLYAIRTILAVRGNELFGLVATSVARRILN